MPLQGFSKSIELQRIILWAASSLAVSLLLYYRLIVEIYSWMTSIVPGETQVYPIAGIIFVAAFILLRKSEIRFALRVEGGYRSKPITRVAGLVLAFAPALALGLLNTSASSIEVAAVILTLVLLGIFAAINPSTSKLILPYAIIYMAATLSPLMLHPIIGEPLADLSYLIVSQAIGISGIPITQTGRTLQLISKKDETISFTVSPDCSSISSITVFLLLCGLMHLDLKKKRVHTLMLALMGTSALIILNAVRIVILVWTGYLGGDWAMWNTHSWLGYAIMISFYAVATKIYISLK